MISLSLYIYIYIYRERYIERDNSLCFYVLVMRGDGLKLHVGGSTCESNALSKAALRNIVLRLVLTLLEQTT